MKILNEANKPKTESLIRYFYRLPGWRDIFLLRKKCKNCGKRFNFASYIRSYKEDSPYIKNRDIMRLRSIFQSLKTCPSCLIIKRANLRKIRKVCVACKRPYVIFKTTKKI